MTASPKTPLDNPVMNVENGSVDFENVTFAYPHEKEAAVSRTILNHMDLQIKPGEYVAITGRSGCGKSTMFNLITNLYETHLGAVKLDGIFQSIFIHREQVLQTETTVGFLTKRRVGNNINIRACKL